MFGLDRRRYLLASLLGRGGKYFVVAGVVLVAGDAARSMSESELYIVIGVVSLGVLVAYLSRRYWVPEHWRGTVP